MEVLVDSLVTEILHSDTLKVLGVSAGNFGMSLTEINAILQFILAVISICWMVRKFYIALWKNKGIRWFGG